MFNSGQANRDWKAVVSAVWNFWTSKTGAFILAVSGIAVGYYIFYISRPILKYETEIWLTVQTLLCVVFSTKTAVHTKLYNMLKIIVLL